MGAQFIGHRVNEAALRQLITGPRGGVNRDLRRRARNVEAQARALCPVVSGNLRSTIRTEYSGDHADITAGPAHYLGWLLYGRGPVVATRAKALRFVIGGTVFFRKRVGPAAANNFLAKALIAARG